ncbi:MAG TPA: heavy-metal-associated domain-containing protein [Acidimicrobiales bacterium]|nr:heavy-metal-associated domain-containing protein [Acidimicrobiales bacterium]
MPGQESASVPAETPLREDGQPLVTVELKITGMHCASCSALINETLADSPGVLKASVDLEPGLAVVAYDPRVVTLEGLVSMIAELGYGAALVD